MMSADDLREVVTVGLGPAPTEAWSRSAGTFRSAVTYSMLLRIAARVEQRSRLSVADRAYRIDPAGARLVTHLGPELSVLLSSAVVDEGGRLERFDFEVAPLEELLFHYAPADGEWAAFCVGAWSDTSLLFLAANRLLFDALPAEPVGRAEMSDSQEGGFAIGGQTHGLASTSYRFASGATLVWFRSTPVHRDTLGVSPSRVVLQVQEHRVELLEAHVPRCDHPWDSGSCR